MDRKKKLQKYHETIGYDDGDDPCIQPDGTWLAPISGSGGTSSASRGNSRLGPVATASAVTVAGRGNIGHRTNAGRRDITAARGLDAISSTGRDYSGRGPAAGRITASRGVVTTGRAVGAISSSVASAALAVATAIVPAAPAPSLTTPADNAAETVTISDTAVIPSSLGYITQPLPSFYGKLKLLSLH